MAAPARVDTEVRRAGGSRRKVYDTDEEARGRSIDTMDLGVSSAEDRDAERDIDPSGNLPGSGPRLTKIGGALTGTESMFQEIQIMSLRKKGFKRSLIL